MYFLHNSLEPNKQVYQQILQLNAQGIQVPLWLHEFKNIDLPILGYISHRGYVLSINGQNKLVWKRGVELIPYLYNGEEPKE